MLTQGIGDGYVLYNAEMKPETNNEMDLLLRRLGRRDGAIVSDATGDHLDTDELSAYAENAVPLAARSRYTAHLAECTRCRELVVQLSSSAGVVAAAETATVLKPSVLKTFLASLFTPMVLRYAVPALGLIIVAAIGFMLLRDRAATNYDTQVAKNEERPTPVPTLEMESRGVLNPTNDSPAAPTPSAEARVSRPKNDLQTEAAPVANAPPVVSVQTEVAKDASAAQPKLEQQPPSANEPRPPKPAPTTVPEEKKKDAAATAAAATPATDNRAFRMQEREDQTAANRKAGTADSVGPQAGAGSLSVLQAERRRMSERDESAETRSVAGRRFRKQRGIWIDTAYDSSRDTMTVARGSEPYRALIADEPEIKRIADQLDGEIIVVWKGRAYRIR